MDGTSLDQVNSTLYLGVTLNSKLQWDDHIRNIVGYGNRMLGFLQRALRRCPEHIKTKAYQMTVRPKLEYCSAIWDPYQTCYIKDIEKIQRRAVRFVKKKLQLLFLI